MPFIPTTVIILLGTASLALAGFMNPQPPYGLCDRPVALYPPLFMFPPYCLEPPTSNAASSNLKVPSTGVLLLVVLATLTLSSALVMAGGPSASESQSATTSKAQTLAATIKSRDDTRFPCRDFLGSEQACYAGGWLCIFCTDTVSSAASAAVKAPSMILLLLVVFATTVLGSNVVEAGVSNGRHVITAPTSLEAPSPTDVAQPAITSNCAHEHGSFTDSEGPFRPFDPSSFPSSTVSKSATEQQRFTYSGVPFTALDPRSNDLMSAATANCGSDCSTPGAPRSYPATPVSSETSTRPSLVPPTLTTIVDGPPTITVTKILTMPLPGSTVTQTIATTFTERETSTETKHNRPAVTTATYTQPGSTVVKSQTVSLAPTTVTKIQQITITYTESGPLFVTTETVSLPPKTITETRQQTITSTVFVEVPRLPTQSFTTVARELSDRTPTNSAETAMTLPSPPEPTWDPEPDDRLLLDLDLHKMLSKVTNFSEEVLQNGVDQIDSLIDKGVEHNPHPGLELLGEAAKNLAQNAENIVGGTLLDFPDVIFGKPKETEEATL